MGSKCWFILQLCHVLSYLDEEGLKTMHNLVWLLFSYRFPNFTTLGDPLSNLRDQSLITGRGVNNGKMAGLKHFVPPQDRVKPFVPTPPSFFSRVEDFCAPPSIWLKLQATTSKLPQNFSAPLFRSAKTLHPFVLL